MATIPTPPTFASNDHSLANLQALAACARFVGQVDSSSGTPQWHFRKTAGQSIPANTLTALTFGHVPLDTDGVSDGTGALIVTRGLYDCSVTVPVIPLATNDIFRLYLRITTTSANTPHPNVTQVFGTRSCGAGTDTGRQVSNTARGLTPFPVYPGDIIYAYAFTGGAMNTTVAASYGGGTGNCDPTFTGRYVQYL